MILHELDGFKKDFNINPALRSIPLKLISSEWVNIPSKWINIRNVGEIFMISGNLWLSYEDHIVRSGEGKHHRVIASQNKVVTLMTFQSTLKS